MDRDFIELLAQRCGCLLRTGIFPQDQWRERMVVGINPHKSLPEGIQGYRANVGCQGASYVQSLIDGLGNNLDQGIGVHRHLTCIRRRKLVRTLGKDLWDRVPQGIKQ
jgi:hypothetical protein